jgi:hypothetical protein
MTAVVKTSIRIPEDAFPTITRVPGAMINFRYYVEVVTDLRGKLTSPDRFIPRFNMVSGGTTFSPSGQILNPTDSNGVTANWAGNILDTDTIRREKGVISVAFEVVVGTRDSQRGKAKRKSSTAGDSTTSQAAPPTSTMLFNPVDGEEWPEASPMHNTHSEYETQEDYFPEEEEHWAEYPEEYPEHFQRMDPIVAPPEVEEPVDEKTRVRRHEEALLPSQPPDENEAGPSTAPMDGPTAPVLPDDHHLQDYEHLPSPDVSGRPPAVRSADSLQTVVENGTAGPSEPRVSDDKQELERHRLEGQASAPQEEPNGEGLDRPSAPVFDEDDQLVGGTAHADESLPRYQR